MSRQSHHIHVRFTHYLDDRFVIGGSCQESEGTYKSTLTVPRRFLGFLTSISHFSQLHKNASCGQFCESFVCVTFRYSRRFSVYVDLCQLISNFLSYFLALKKFLKKSKQAGSGNDDDITRDDVENIRYSPWLVVFLMSSGPGDHKIPFYEDPQYLSYFPNFLNQVSPMFPRLIISFYKTKTKESLQAVHRDARTYLEWVNEYTKVHFLLLGIHLILETLPF